MAKSKLGMTDMSSDPTQELTPRQKLRCVCGTWMRVSHVHADGSSPTAATPLPPPPPAENPPPPAAESLVAMGEPAQSEIEVDGFDSIEDELAVGVDTPREGSERGRARLAESERRGATPSRGKGKT